MTASTITQGKEFFMTEMAKLHRRAKFIAVFCLSLFCGLVFAQDNAIQSVEALQQGSGVVVKVTLKNPPEKQPIGFAITNPARVAVDFAGTRNATGNSKQDISLGEVRSVNIVEAGDRSRLVFNLKNPLNFSTEVQGNVVTVTIDKSPGLPETKQVAAAVEAMPRSEQPPAPVEAPSAVAAPAITPMPAAVEAPAPMPISPLADRTLRNIDFRRGTIGEGRIIVDLPGNHIAVDVRQKGRFVEVDFLKANVPDALRRRMDVTDFGTPATSVTTKQHGENVRMLIETAGVWEYSAYQSDAQLVVEIKPIKEDPNKLTQGTQGYRGEKLSLNFQNVEVRAVLQVIADFTGLNIITSDTVSGNLTLRLKDVPWDQALDIVMRAKGLDMRKNGSVLWIAPRDELLTKEKLELEQRSQIAELEPIRMEVFQLNYQKAQAFRRVFGIKEDGTTDPSNKNSMLSKRGSAVLDPRSNQIFITDIPSKLEEIRKLIEKTDIAQKQVMIEARIVEADDKFSRNLGAKLGFFGDGWKNAAVGSSYGNLPQATGVTSTTAGTAVNLPANLIGTNPAGTLGVSLFNSAATRFLNLELSALEADNKGKIISSPRVVTGDKVKALIEQGTEIPYLTASSSGATTIQYRKAVLKLEVTPQITPDGNVILTVDVSKDNPSLDIQLTYGVAIDTKHVQTEVLVENGGTVVLGGIFQMEQRDKVSQVPFLGDIPILGNAFKNTERTNNKTELLIFLTPKVMSGRQPK